MKILNLYCGIGGNRKLWGNEHEITAVELDERIADVYKDNFPNDKVIITDAHEYLLKYFNEFDFIWSSPPCPTHSRMMKATRHDVRKYPDMSLYQEIIYLRNFFKGKWVVENVKPYYTALIAPSAIIGRHYIWSNFYIKNLHKKTASNFIKRDSPNEIREFKERIGIKFEANIYYGKNHSPGQVLRNCVEPEFGLYILNCAMKEQKQLNLFE